MKKIIFLMPLMFFVVGCDKFNALIDMPSTLNGMQDTMSKMKDTTVSMNQGMNTTNKGIHNQTLKLAMDGLTDKNNWDEINPVPFKLMPFGKAFAEEATADELMLYFYETIEELNEAKLDLGTDIQTGDTFPYIAGSKELNDVMQEKMVKLTILSIIAGFVPQSLPGAIVSSKTDVVGEIINQQILGHGETTSGRYRDTAIAFLALRAKFINDIRLTNSDLAVPLTNVGMVEDAIDFTQRLDFISKMPHAELIQAKVSPQFHVADKVGGKVNPMNMDMTTVLDVNAPLTCWKAIRTGIEKDLKVGQASVGVDTTQAAADAQNEQQRVETAKTIVDKYLQSWSVPAQQN